MSESIFQRAFWLVLLCGTLLPGCEKDLETATVVEEDLFPQPTRVSASFAGHVERVSFRVGAASVDDTVRVSIGDRTTTVDDAGDWNLSDVEVEADRAFVRFEAAGYHRTSRTSIVEEGGTYTLKTDLLLVESTSLTGSEDQSLQSINEVAARASIPSGAVVNDRQETLDGDYEASLVYLDPSSESTYRRLPGDQRGINAEGAEQQLTIYGTLLFAVRQPTGEELQLSEATPASMRFPAGNAGVRSGLERLPLWRFNPERAAWIQEGSASLEGDAFVGTVSEPGFWSVAEAGNLVGITGSVRSGDTTLPVADLTVNLISNGVSRPIAQTDGAGNYAAKVAGGVPFTVSIHDACGEVLGDLNVEPIESLSRLDDIVLTQEDTYRTTVSTFEITCDSADLYSPISEIHIIQDGNDVTEGSLLDSINYYWFSHASCSDSPYEVSIFYSEARDSGVIARFTLDPGTKTDTSFNFCKAPSPGRLSVLLNNDSWTSSANITGEFNPSGSDTTTFTVRSDNNAIDGKNIEVKVRPAPFSIVTEGVYSLDGSAATLTLMNADSTRDGTYTIDNLELSIQEDGSGPDGIVEGRFGPGKIPNPLGTDSIEATIIFKYEP